MGEGRKDRSNKRQKFIQEIRKSSSDSELAQGKSKGKSKGKGKSRRGRTKERWPFLEGLTVDELARYRRRRVHGHPKDSLAEYLEVDNLREGKELLSEYKRAFASVEDLFKVKNKGSSEDCSRFIEDSYRQDHEKVVQCRRKEQSSSLALVDDDTKTMETETENSRFVAHANPIGRPPLVRRGTSLKREGQFYGDTESYSAYVPFVGQHRAELARRPTSLRMEGDIDTMTEKCEKFIEWLNVSRPELMRLPTNLKLEGDFECSTESHDKYVPFVGTRRPELLRQGANLKLDGETAYVPEYTDVFRDHRVRDKQMPKKPETHLKPGGGFYEKTEISDNFIDPQVKGVQQALELSKSAIDAEERKKKKVLEMKKKKEEEMKMLVSKLEDLKGPPMEIPEYKDAYKNFPRDRPKIVKPEDEIGLTDGSNIFSSSSTVHSKFATKIDQDPEYKSMYIETIPRDRPIYRKPPLALRSNPVPTSGRGSRTERHPECRWDSELTSEVRSQYIPYGQVPRVETLKMPSNLRLEGSVNFEPEYRNAYCSRQQYQECTEPRIHRMRDRSLSASRRRENYWINNNNGEQLDDGVENLPDDQDAFQILNTRIHEGSVTGKPPTGNRRDSRTSVQRPSRLDIGDRTLLKNRSPSPSYRLHVCNVDDEPQGFGRRRRSPSTKSITRISSTSPDALVSDTDNRPYSPSFGREKQNEKSFVVLPNAFTNDIRRKRFDRNANIDSRHLIPPKGRPRTPTNWMPPWYDSTNTI